MRSSTRSGNASDVARLAKKNENRNHFRDTVMASIYPDVSNVRTVPVDVIAQAFEDAKAKAEADFLTHLEVEKKTKKPFVDRIRDYADYAAQGWNPDVQQQTKFDRPDGPPTFRYLMPADGTDTGFIHNSAPFIGGKAQWNDDATPKIADEPMGRWILDRAERAECEVPRSKRHFFIEIDGEMKEVGKNIVHGPDGENAFLYVCDFDKTEVDPSLRLPVIVDVERWTEEAQVVSMSGRSFAHRNLLGMLRFEDLEGKPGPTYPIMEVDPKNIERKRRDYANLVKSWRELTDDERSNARFSGQRRVPRGAGYESFLVKTEGVLAGKDNYFVEVKRDNDDKWVPIRKG
jgi:hypothetical protein